MIRIDATSLSAALVGLVLASGAPAAPPLAEDGIERVGPPALDDFEVDTDADGVPDGGWYNLRDVKLAGGGVVGASAGTGTGHCLRFENDRPGRQARISRGFGIDGRVTEALIIGLWVRSEGVQPGERVGDAPALIIDLIGLGLRTLDRGSLGPWPDGVGRHWTRVSKRIAVPPDTRDAIMSVGLLGATGVLEIDGLTIEEVPIGGSSSTDLLLNGGFERGDPDPPAWLLEHGARRVHAGFGSASCLDLAAAGSRALNGLAVDVEGLSALEIELRVRAAGLRGAGGAVGEFFFLDPDGQLLRGQVRGALAFRWSGTFPWRADRAVVPVPRGAFRAVLQLEKSDPNGSIQIDDVSVRASPRPEEATWTPDHVRTETATWEPVVASTSIEPGSALDASFLLQAPAGDRGRVIVRDGRLAFEDGGRARFFGVALLAPTAFAEPEFADALADRLARSGVNLVRLGDLDAPLGPGRSLFDDTRDDTKALDSIAMAKLDHLISALEARGIYLALELQTARRYRAGDEVEGFRDLPPGGGSASAFDPALRDRTFRAAEMLLTHVNPETGRALLDDPALAWVALAGELSVFDLLDRPDALPAEENTILKEQGQAHSTSSRSKTWQAIESAQWTALAADLRRIGLKAPIAGGSHWRRDPPEYVAAQTADGLDLIDDRLFWSAPPWAKPDRRSIVRSLSGGLVPAAARKRRSDRPYVVGQWCDHTEGAWAWPFESADLLLAARTASAADWDALVRRGVFFYPKVWGSAATGTGGVDDFYHVPEVINGIPPVYALLPHAASIVLRGQQAADGPTTPGRRAADAGHAPVPGWEMQAGRLVLETPFTQGLAGWSVGRPARCGSIAVESDTPFAAIVATSMGPEPIAAANRLLVTAVAQVEPTGLLWVDEWRREVASPGRPPLLREPVRARLAWKRPGTIRAFALDDSGKRTHPIDLETTADGVRLEIDGRSSQFHYELVVE